MFALFASQLIFKKFLFVLRNYLVMNLMFLMFRISLIEQKQKFVNFLLSCQLRESLSEWSDLDLD